MDRRGHPGSTSAVIVRGRRLAIAAAAIAAAVVSNTACHSQASDDAGFYAGKQITFIVGTAAGGGYDAYARVLAPFLSARIPGRPHVVVQNMPGSAGVTAGRYVYNVAPKDGTVIGINPADYLLAEVWNPEQVRFDSRKLSWIGTIATITDLLAVFKATGINTIDDARKKEVVVGASAAIATNSLEPALANALLGTKFRIVKGYTGGSDPLTLAMERREIDGRTNNWASWKILRPSWITDNLLSYLLQFGPKDPELEGVPAISDLVSTPRDKAFVALLEIAQRTGRSVFGPPDLPSDRLTALRKAFDETMVDPAFVAQMQKLHLELSPRKGAEVQAELQRVLNERDIVPDLKATLNLN